VLKKQTILVILMLLASPVALIVNVLTMRSPVLATVASLVFFSIDSWVIAKLLYGRYDRSFRVTLGFITILLLLAVTGNVLIVFASFTEVVSLVSLIVFNLFLVLAFARFRRIQSPKVIDEPQTVRNKKAVRADALLVILFLLSAAVAFLLLWLGRTGEGGASVWLTVPNLFIPLFLYVSVLLTIILVFSHLNNALKLGLVCIFSFLAHSLFLLVWYPGRFGDPWLHLGSARYIARTGVPYAYSWMVQQFLVLDLMLNVQEALTVFFGRMFLVDVYWSHVVLVPLLWSVLVPLIAYKIAEMLTVNKSKIFPVLAAVASLLFPSMILWGAVSVPNSLGFVFFFVAVLFLLLWISRGDKQMWAMSFLAGAVAFLAHPQAGFFAFYLLLWGTVIKKTSRKLWVFASYVLLFVAYPLALSGVRGSFLVSGLFVLENFSSFQSEISTVLLAFGIVGLVFGVRSRRVDVKIALMLFVFYLTVLAEYYLTGFGMAGLPYSAERILTLADFLLVPFVALGFMTIAVTVGKGFALKSRVASSVGMPFKKFKFNVSGRFVGLLLVCLFLSLQITVTLYQAYPRSEIVTVQPAAYEVEAIQFIDSNSPGRYVVLGHPAFASLAVGFLGLDYGWAGGERGLFGMPQSQAYQGGWYPTVQLYFEMTKNPSVGLLEQAMDFANATLSYFVLSVREPKFNDALRRTLEILPPIRVFGDEELYVFAYPLPLFEEDGAMVKVVFDDGAGGEQNVLTRFTYMVESGVNSTLALTGHLSYNVSDFPVHWNFLELLVNNASSRFDDSSDVNAFVYVKGLQPSDVLTVKWLFNSRYPNVGWKEDSFKQLNKWHTHERYKGTMTPNITSDGNVLRMWYSFTPGRYWYYYYVTSVDLSTNDYPYLLVRWRCDQPVAVASVYFEGGGSMEIVPFGGKSLEWSAIVVPLTSDSIVSTVMIGLSNVKNQQLSGQATLEVDYILFASNTLP